MLILQVLLVFMIISAVIAVEIADLLSAVISVGAVGLGLAVAFLFLQAPDLAIVQLAVEILALIILIRATMSFDGTCYNRSEVFVYISSAIFFGVFLVGAYVVLEQLPVFGKPIMRVSRTYIEQCLQKVGAANIVSSVILDYRAYDTLGEATILFTAVIGVIAVMRKIGRIKK
jgi:multisubunit Na+/H+ antiporter MnhB subunit